VPTHLNFEIPTQNFIGKYPASMRDYSDLGIPHDKVILLDKTKESLEPLNPRLKPGSSMH
jgi:hypothetical protein